MTTEETVNKLDEWRQLVESANASGKPIQEWCEENNVSTRQFYYWRKKLSEAEEDNRFYELSDDQSFQEHHSSKELILNYKEFSLIIPEGVDPAVLKKVITVLSHA